MNGSENTITIELAGLKATRDLAGRLARLVRIGDVICLQGDLGVGKTEFARAFIRAQTEPNEDVPSPTFTLVQTYDGESGEIWHFDLYRLDKPEDAFELGIEDAFAGAITIIEWAEKLGPYLPRGRLDVHLSVTKGKNHRQAILIGHTDWVERLRESGHA